MLLILIFFSKDEEIFKAQNDIVDLKKSLEIKERLLDKDSKELGNANGDVAEAYVAVLNFKEALPFCLKALEIHKAQLGQNSVGVGYDWRILGVIYNGFDDHDKAFQQNLFSRKVLKKWGRCADLLRGEMDDANMQIALGRYDESVDENGLKSWDPGDSIVVVANSSLTAETIRVNVAENGNLCLCGFSSEQWEVHLPADVEISLVQPVGTIGDLVKIVVLDLESHT